MIGKIEQLIKEFELLSSERSSSGIDDWWNQISHYVVPQYYNLKYKDQRSEQNLPDDIFNDTARMANNTFAAGLMGHLTSSAQRWFDITIRDRKLLKVRTVKEYLEEVQEKIYDAFSYTNFYSETRKVYKDIGAIGSANVYQERDKVNVLHYTAFEMVNCYWGANHRDEVDRVYRLFKFNCLQIMQRWGDTAPKEVRDAYDKGDTGKLFTILHIVKPREERDESKSDKFNKPYSVHYIMKDDQHLLEESGLDFFPWLTARLDTITGQKYGYSPAMYALGSIKIANAKEKTVLQAEQLATLPPLHGSLDAYPNGIDYSPSAFNIRLSNDPTDIAQPINTGANPLIGREGVKDIEKKINDAFFVDLFLALANVTKRISIPEANELISEKLLILGSGLDHIMNEYLEPAIVSMYNELERRGELPDLPAELKGQPLSIEYISPLAKAQKAAKSGSIQNLLSVVAQIAQFSPEVLDNINVDEVYKQLHDSSGAPITINNNDNTIAQIRQQRQQAQVALAQMQNRQEQSITDEKQSKANLNNKKASE